MSRLKWIVAYLFDCTQATSCSEDFVREPWRIASAVSEFRELCLDKSRLDHKLEVMAWGGHNRVSRYRLRPSGPLRLRKM
jgi:hypothetical protein